MDVVDLKKLVGNDETGFSSRMVVAAGELSVVVWALGPHRRMPELTFSRAEVAYLVLEGVLRVLVDDRTRVVECGQVVNVERGVHHQLSNTTDSRVCVVVMRAPGPACVKDISIGKVVCPVCAAAAPVEKGDRAGDRFVCRDCGYVMTLEDVEGLLRPGKCEPAVDEVRE